MKCFYTFIISYINPKYKEKSTEIFSAFFLTGNFLSSQHVSMQVLSASKCLTTVFGMGTGGTI